MPRTVNESSHSELLIRSDGTAAGTSASARIVAEGFVGTDAVVDLPAAFAAAAAAIGGGRTAAQVRDCVREFFAAARAQARAAGGWS